MWQKLNIMRQLWQLCDISLESQDKAIFMVHSAVLAASSEAIYSFLVNRNGANIKETSPGKLLVQNIKADVLETTLDFIYGETPTSRDSLEKLKQGAEILGIHGAVVYCNEKLKLCLTEKTSGSTSAENMSVAGTHGSPQAPKASQCSRKLGNTSSTHGTSSNRKSLPPARFCPHLKGLQGGDDIWHADNTDYASDDITLKMLTGVQRILEQQPDSKQSDASGKNIPELLSRADENDVDVSNSDNINSSLTNQSSGCPLTSGKSPSPSMEMPENNSTKRNDADTGDLPNESGNILSKKRVHVVSKSSGVFSASSGSHCSSDCDITSPEPDTDVALPPNHSEFMLDLTLNDLSQGMAKCPHLEALAGGEGPTIPRLASLSSLQDDSSIPDRAMDDDQLLTTDDEDYEPLTEERGSKRKVPENEESTHIVKKQAVSKENDSPAGDIDSGMETEEVDDRRRESLSKTNLHQAEVAEISGESSCDEEAPDLVVNVCSLGPSQVVHSQAAIATNVTCTIQSAAGRKSQQNLNWKKALVAQSQTEGGSNVGEGTACSDKVPQLKPIPAFSLKATEMAPLTIDVPAVITTTIHTGNTPPSSPCKPEPFSVQCRQPTLAVCTKSPIQGHQASQNFSGDDRFVHRRSSRRVRSLSPCSLTVSGGSPSGGRSPYNLPSPGHPLNLSNLAVQDAGPGRYLSPNRRLSPARQQHIMPSPGQNGHGSCVYPQYQEISTGSSQPSTTYDQSLLSTYCSASPQPGASPGYLGNLPDASGSRMGQGSFQNGSMSAVSPSSRSQGYSTSETAVDMVEAEVRAIIGQSPHQKGLSPNHRMFSPQSRQQSPDPRQSRSDVGQYSPNPTYCDPGYSISASVPNHGNPRAEPQYAYSGSQQGYSPQPRSGHYSPQPYGADTRQISPSAGCFNPSQQPQSSSDYNTYSTNAGLYQPCNQADHTLQPGLFKLDRGAISPTSGAYHPVPAHVMPGCRSPVSQLYGYMDPAHKSHTSIAAECPVASQNAPQPGNDPITTSCPDGGSVPASTEVVAPAVESQARQWTSVLEDSLLPAPDGQMYSADSAIPQSQSSGRQWPIGQELSTASTASALTITVTPSQSKVTSGKGKVTGAKKSLGKTSRQSPGQMFQCTEAGCSFKYKSAATLQEHLYNRHGVGEANRSCLHCNKIFCSAR